MWFKSCALTSPFRQYYKKKAISKALYDYCVKMRYVDAKLAAKWKKPGYEYLVRGGRGRCLAAAC